MRYAKGGKSSRISQISPEIISKVTKRLKLCNDVFAHHFFGFEIQLPGSLKSRIDFLERNSVLTLN